MNISIDRDKTAALRVVLHRPYLDDQAPGWVLWLVRRLQRLARPS